MLSAERREALFSLRILKAKGIMLYKSSKSFGDGVTVKGTADILGIRAELEKQGAMI